MEKLMKIKEACNEYMFLENFALRLGPVYDTVRVIDNEDEEEFTISLYGENGELLGRAFTISSSKETFILEKPNGKFLVLNAYGRIIEI